MVFSVRPVVPGSFRAAPAGPERPFDWPARIGYHERRTGATGRRAGPAGGEQRQETDAWPISRSICRDGFENDQVVVIMDGREVFSSEAVTTNRLLGIAETITLTTDTDGHEVTVELPKRGLSGHTSVPAAERCYVGASLQGGAVEMIVSPEPFGYA